MATFDPLATLAEGCDHPHVTVGETETQVTASWSKANQLVEEEAKVQSLTCQTSSQARFPI